MSIRMLGPYNRATGPAHEPRAPDTIRTCDRRLRRAPLAPIELQKALRPLPAASQSAKWGLEAPVAQLDRALPSEGKGHTFESCRVRHIFNDLLNFNETGICVG